MNRINTIPPRLRRLRESIPPLQKILLSFVILILTGSGLLLLPISTTKNISFVDALFTSTSAVCVTGLIVLDTAKDFTLFGKTVIALLIQFGGLGVMTVSIALLSFMGGNYSIKWRFTFESMYSDLHTIPIRSILKRIIFYTITIEFIAAAFLFSRFIHYFPPLEALGHSLFHAVSAFCNAGFSTFSDNLEGFRFEGVILVTISCAVILGGLGFFVLAELIKTKSEKGKKFFMQYSLHTRLVLIMTVLLLAYGTVAFLVLEWDYVLKEFSFADKIMAAFFHSMSCRTAGFNTIPIGSLRESTLFTLIGLMFVGGSPGSIAGGIKTTTIAVVAGVVFAKFRNKKQVVLWGRSLEHETIDRATTLIILSGLFIYASTFALLFLNSFDISHTFLAGFFEVTSAFGTVGLSTGVTSTLLNEGKILITLVMFIGRLGPLVLIAVLTTRTREDHVEYPEENIMIG